MLAEGRDPSLERKKRKPALLRASQNNFKSVALDWYERQRESLKENTLRKKLYILNDKLFPSLGAIPINDITPSLVLQALRKIEAEGIIEAANRAKQVASQVFRYAVAQGLCSGQVKPDTFL